MKNLLLNLLHLAVVTAKLCGRGGMRAVIAENLELKQQLIVLRRARQRAPNLSKCDRLLCGFWSLFLDEQRTGDERGAASTFTREFVERTPNRFENARVHDERCGRLVQGSAGELAATREFGTMSAAG